MLTIMAAGQLFAAELSPAEEDSLLYMREEEKVARDVYTALYDKYGLTIFSNIAFSEQKHMDAIKILLVRYNLKDPALGPGVFTNPELQKMYDYLIAMGTNEIEALKVGVIIENTDILDLQEGLAIRPLHKDIQRVYQNLMAGSENHLAAFESVLSNY